MISVIALSVVSLIKQRNIIRFFLMKSGSETRQNMRAHKLLDKYVVYDWVHIGSTQIFIDPDKTKQKLHLAESEQAPDDSKKLARAGGRRRRRRIQSRDHSS